MTFYRWDTQAKFDAWHSTVRQLLGYPLPSVTESGKVDESAPMTTDYTMPNPDGGGVIALVEDDVAALAPVGLGQPCHAPAAPPFDPFS